MTVARSSLAALFLLPLAAHAQDRDVRITGSEGTNMAAAVSPDGGQMVLDLQGTLWVMDAGGDEARAITDKGRRRGNGTPPSPARRRGRLGHKLDLVDLTAADPRWHGHRCQEVLRAGYRRHSAAAGIPRLTRTSSPAPAAPPAKSARAAAAAA